MGAMRNHAMDTESLKMLSLMNEIANARDEYREEMFRLREENKKLQAMAEQYLMALLTRAINEQAND